MDTVPFHFDAFAGFGTVQGLARLDEFGLELQFSTRDALFGVFQSGQRSLRVAPEALLSVRYRSGLCGLAPRIELRVRDLAAIRGLPEADQGRVRLKLAWGDRADGRAFAADLEAMRSHRRIQQLDRQLQSLATPLPDDWQSPPAPPSAATNAARLAQRASS